MKDEATLFDAELSEPKSWAGNDIEHDDIYEMVEILRMIHLGLTCSVCERATVADAIEAYKLIRERVESEDSP